MKKIIKIFWLFAVLFVGFPVFADTTFNLKIITPTDVLYDQEITVTPCDNDVSDTNEILEATVYCALLQTGLANDWTWYETDAFLNSIDSVTNNDADNGIYWGWFVNLELGQVALNKYNPENGDSVLLNYGVNPLKISVDKENPEIGETVNFAALEFGYDSSWNPVWVPAVSGKISIDSNIFDLNEEGEYSLKITDKNIITVKAQKDNFIDSPEITIIPQPKPHHSSGGGAVVVADPVKRFFNIEKAFQYLILQQKDDGTFGENLYTDWATLAFASSTHKDQILKLAKHHNESIDENFSLTDYERKSMALLSLELNPYSVNNKNYIDKIVAQFDGKQFGDPNEDNDDIFALIVLQNAGFEEGEKIIMDDLAFILCKQKEDGSWDKSVDMTGAAIEGLSAFKRNTQIENALAKAKEFLKTNQKDDGGWGNVSSTAWALEGIMSLGEKPEDWKKNENSPLDYLASQQDADGGIMNENIQNKIWETAYVVSALSGKTWNQIMQKVEKPIITPQLEHAPVVKISKKIIKENLTATVVNTAPTEITPPQPRQTQEPKKNWFTKLLDKIFNIF